MMFTSCRLPLNCIVSSTSWLLLSGLAGPGYSIIVVVVFDDVLQRCDVMRLTDSSNVRQTSSSLSLIRGAINFHRLFFGRRRPPYSGYVFFVSY